MHCNRPLTQVQLVSSCQCISCSYSTEIQALWGEPEQLKICFVWAGRGLAKFSDGAENHIYDYDDQLPL